MTARLRSTKEASHYAGSHLVHMRLHYEKPTSTKRLGQPQRPWAGIQWYIQPQPCIGECVGMGLITGTIEPQMSRNVADSGLCMSIYWLVYYMELHCSILPVLLA